MFALTFKSLVFLISCSNGTHSIFFCSESLRKCRPLPMTVANWKQSTIRICPYVRVAEVVSTQYTVSVHAYFSAGFHFINCHAKCRVDSEKKSRICSFNTVQSVIVNLRYATAIPVLPMLSKTRPAPSYCWAEWDESQQVQQYFKSTSLTQKWSAARAWARQGHHLWYCLPYNARPGKELSLSW